MISPATERHCTVHLGLVRRSHPNEAKRTFDTPTSIQLHFNLRPHFNISQIPARPHRIGTIVVRLVSARVALIEDSLSTCNYFIANVAPFIGSQQDYIHTQPNNLLLLNPTQAKPYLNNIGGSVSGFFQSSPKTSLGFKLIAYGCLRTEHWASKYVIELAYLCAFLSGRFNHLLDPLSCQQAVSHFFHNTIPEYHL